MRDQTLLARAQTMRKEPTSPEYRLWLALRAGRLDGAKFRRQQLIGPYIADIACRLPRKIVVEADGDTHAVQEGYDATRSAYLQKQGYIVLRFTNREIMTNLEGVLTTIENALQPTLPNQCGMIGGSIVPPARSMECRGHSIPLNRPTLP